MLDDRDPETSKNLQSKAVNMNLPVGLPDILSCDGRYVYMRSLPFNLKGERKFVEYVPVEGAAGDDVHLFSPTGFLDDTMWHRTYWVYGRAWASAAGGYFLAGRLVPAGRIMVFDDTTVCGYGRRWQYFRWSTPYVNHLFAATKEPDILRMTAAEPNPRRKRTARSNPVPGRYRPRASPTAGPTNCPCKPARWCWPTRHCSSPGRPTWSTRKRPPSRWRIPRFWRRSSSRARLRRAQGGHRFGRVPRDGKGLVSYRLPSMPIFDGMAAADEKLYLSTTDGKIFCLGAGRARRWSRRRTGWQLLVPATPTSRC